MPHRPGTWVRGEHLVRDDLSDVVVYSGELVKTWDGLWIRADLADDELYRDPQDFVRAKGDPFPAREPVRAETASSAVDFTNAYIINGVLQPLGAAAHLFPVFGIGEMIVLASAGADDVATCARAFVVR